MDRISSGRQERRKQNSKQREQHVQKLIKQVGGFFLPSLEWGKKNVVLLLGLDLFLTSTLPFLKEDLIFLVGWKKRPDRFENFY